MRRLAISFFACAALSLASATATAQTNLLVDPSYESNPLSSLGSTVGNFNANQGIWGVEGGITRVNAEPPVYPPDGDYMLRLPAVGGSEAQAFQITDLTAFASLIDSGNAVLQAGALFNAHEDVSAAVGGVRFWLFDNPVWGSHHSLPTIYAGLDGDPSTWEPITLSAALPANTRWVVTDFFFVNSSLDGEVGYIDVPYLHVVPEPHSLLLLLLGSVLALLARQLKR